MTTSQYVSLGISALIGGVLWHFGWREYFLDRFRQNLFEIRDALFLEAFKEDDGLRLDSPEHDLLRESVNSLIRYAHRISWLGLFLAFLPPFSKAIDASQSPIGRLSATLPNGSLKKRVQRLQLAIGIEILGYLVNQSLITFVLKTALKHIARLLFFIAKVLISVFSGSLKSISVAFRVTDQEINSMVQAVNKSAAERLDPATAMAIQANSLGSPMLEFA